MSNTYRDTTNHKCSPSKMERAMYDKTADPRSSRAKKVAHKKSRMGDKGVVRKEVLELV